LKPLTTIGIDLGKNTFHLVGLDRNGAIVLRQKLSRRQVEARLANMPPCLIGMEPCVGAHHLSRQLKAYGHDARLMPARYVRPYSKGQKNDFRDAEAIAEAVLRPTMKFVAIKTVEQLDLQALHRVRERLVCQRTSVINQIRAFLLERGIAVRQGLRALRRMLFVQAARAVLLRPQTIISTATVAAIGRGDAFSKGRDFSAWLGLVPRQMSTGGRTILGPISKRHQDGASPYIEPRSRGSCHGLKSWIDAAARRLNRANARHGHEALGSVILFGQRFDLIAIALANKIARIVWGVLHGGRNFDIGPMKLASQAA